MELYKQELWEQGSNDIVSLKSWKILLSRVLNPVKTSFQSQNEINTSFRNKKPGKWLTIRPIRHIRNTAGSSEWKKVISVGSLVPQEELKDTRRSIVTFIIIIKRITQTDIKTEELIEEIKWDNSEQLTETFQCLLISGKINTKVLNIAS